MSQLSKWETGNPAAAEAVKHPRVADALAAMEKLDAAIVKGDKAGFLAAFDEDSVTNNPMNAISWIADSERFFGAGKIAYEYFHRTIDFAAPRRDDEVIVMGGEVFEPLEGNHNAGKTVHRRFTDLWQLKDGQWKVALRQATVFAVE